MFDYFFVMHRPSSVGLPSILNAMHAIPSVPYSAIEDLKSEIERIPELNSDNPAVKECCDRLEMLYAQGGYSRPVLPEGEIRVETISPVCVSYGVNPYESHNHHGFDREFLSPKK